MKILDGLELTGYIKERQIKQVRALRQSWRVVPKLAILCVNGHSNIYAKLKSEYGQDVLIEVDIHNLTKEDLPGRIDLLNNDESVHGIIVQLTDNPDVAIETAISCISKDKDVDNLTGNSSFISPAVMSVDWLLAGYNVNLPGKKIAVIGHSRFVNLPLVDLWRKAGLEVLACDDDADDLHKIISSSNIIVIASSKKDLISGEMLAPKTAVVDASVATEFANTNGVLATDVYDRRDLTITPKKGGVGPLIIAALFDNVISSARKIADTKGQQDLS